MDFANYWYSSGSSRDEGDPGDPIANSLRFRQEQWLETVTPTIEDDTSSCFSCWIKLGINPYYPCLIGQYQITGSQNQVFSPTYAGPANETPYVAYSATEMMDTSKKMRDVSGWYHIMLVTNADGFRCYINGEEWWFSSARPNYAFLLAYTTYIGATNETTGGYSNYQWRFDGHLAEIHYVDGGGDLLPTDFGRYNAHGVWVNKRYTGPWRNAGFYLDFSDPADIGADRSGNGNHFTGHNFELVDQTSQDYDYSFDTPTQNQPTINFESTSWWYGGGSSANSISYANLSSNTNFQNHTVLTVLPDPGQKVYVEYTTGVPSGGYGPYYIGFTTRQEDPMGYGYLGGPTTPDALGIFSDGGLWVNNALIASNGAPFKSTNVVVMLAYDVNTGEVWQGVDGVWAASGDPATGTNPLYTFPDVDQKYQFAFNENGNNLATRGFINAGGQPFRYEPPEGFTGVGVENLRDAPVLNGREHLRVISEDGASILSSAQSIFPSGLWWIKSRAAVDENQFVDVLRGNNAMTSPQIEEVPYVAPTGNSVAWCFNAPDEMDQTTRESGDIDATAGRTNRRGGFSMVTYTGTGTNGTIAHGLGKVPDFIVSKNRTETWNTNSVVASFVAKFPWLNPSNVNEMMRFNTSEGLMTLHNMYSQQPDQNFLYLTSDAQVNKSGDEYAMYCWNAVPGYSDMGTYTGNGNANGRFIYTGFRPAFVIIKGLFDANWVMYDSTRDIANPNTRYLLVNHTTQELTGIDVDFFANGFKCTTANDYVNGANYKYLYIAFAENPFGGSNTVPATAR